MLLTTLLMKLLRTSVARYFSHHEITSRQLPSAKDIRWLAGQLGALPAFVSGSAVLCGSVAWGTHSARSDIDVAHFGTIEHPQIERKIEDVLERYQERTQNCFIVPNIDIITIGIESNVSIGTNASHSVRTGPVGLIGNSIGGKVMRSRDLVAVFADTFVRFTDHIGSLAYMKAGPWKNFLERHLSPQREDYKLIQREGILSYVEAITTAWEEQPLHRLNLEENYELSRRQLDLAGQAENYPINLMRRILGEMGLYPRPDRAADVLRQFEQLAEPWAKRILANSAPFFGLGSQYDALITDALKANGGLTAVDYQKRFSALFERLPFDRIQENVWEYLGHL